MAEDRLAQIRERLTKFEVPTPLPEGYDPKCTCGTTLIPMCGPCEELHDAISLKREIFYVNAYEDVRWLADALGTLVESAERVYQIRGDIFSEPNDVHRAIKAMGRRLNEVRGLK
jgi:hypothetical protein